MKTSILLVSSLVVSMNCFAQSSSTNTSTTQASDVQVAPKKWSANYFNYMNGPAFAEAENGFSINHYLGFKYKFDSKWGASFTLRPDSNFSNGQESFVMSDPYLRIEYPVLMEAQNGLKLTGNFNVFLPTSEKSKKDNLNGSITTRFNLAKEIGSLSLSYLLIPRLYSYSKIQDGQTVSSHGHYLSASYSLSDFAVIDLGVYPAWTSKRNKEVAFNDLPAFPGMTLNFSKELSLSPYLEIPLMNARPSTSSMGASVNYKLL